MKRSSLLTSLLVLSLVLTACSSAAATGTTLQASDGTQDPGPEGGLSTELKLAVGTLLLDDSEQPVNAETAAELLPLWKAARSLGSSSTITTDEYQAIFKQIQETMPAEQMAAITAMQLTREDMLSLSEKLGIEMKGGGGGPMGTPSAEMLETLQAARESGDLPEMPGGGGGLTSGGGGMPAGGGPGGGIFQRSENPAGAGMDPSMAGAGMPDPDASTSAVRRGGVMQSIPTELLDAVIDNLQDKADGKIVKKYPWRPL
ncbi:MAG TPA: hypothetical protein VN363_09135 [Anaerolineales bacterium]|nr:hypothetical protein [Anaerolineales bacterium]